MTNETELIPFIERVLIDFGLIGAFHSRPSPQQDGYLAWITSAGHSETRDIRIAEMLDELAAVGHNSGVSSRQEVLL